MRALLNGKNETCGNRRLVSNLIYEKKKKNLKVKNDLIFWVF